jgi:hypothetical protein
LKYKLIYSVGCGRLGFDSGRKESGGAEGDTEEVGKHIVAVCGDGKGRTVLGNVRMC